jgi:hypothetical protein
MVAGMNSAKYLIIGGGMVAGYAAKELASKGLGAGEYLIFGCHPSCLTSLLYEKR